MVVKAIIILNYTILLMEIKMIYLCRLEKI